jgi:hypothetical protein
MAFTTIDGLGLTSKLMVIKKGNSYSLRTILTDRYYPITIHPSLTPPIKGGEDMS